MGNGEGSQAAAAEPGRAAAAAAAADPGAAGQTAGRPRRPERWEEPGSDGLEQSEGAVKALTEADRCEISLLRNVRYHEDREAHFARLNRTLSFIVLVTGLATVVALSNLLPESLRIDGRYIAAATSVIGALQLVFGFNKSESLHSDLRRRFLALHADFLDGDVKGIQKRMRALYASEPPTFHAVDTLAYNAAMTALDRPQRYLKRVRWWQRLVRHRLRFEGTAFPRYEELN